MKKRSSGIAKTMAEKWFIKHRALKEKSIGRRNEEAQSKKEISFVTAVFAVLPAVVAVTLSGQNPALHGAKLEDNL